MTTDYLIRRCANNPACPSIQTPRLLATCTERSMATEISCSFVRISQQQRLIQASNSNLPGAVSARLLSPAIRCRIPSMTTCLRVAKNLKSRLSWSSCGSKWLASRTSHAPSTCQSSFMFLDIARGRRLLLRTLLLFSQQSELETSRSECFLISGVLLRRHLLRS
jgi:hypothetical protein